MQPTNVIYAVYLILILHEINNIIMKIRLTKLYTSV